MKYIEDPSSRIPGRAVISLNRTNSDGVVSHNGVQRQRPYNAQTNTILLPETWAVYEGFVGRQNPQNRHLDEVKIVTNPEPKKDNHGDFYLEVRDPTPEEIALINLDLPRQ
jgi:hypothetical protein